MWRALHLRRRVKPITDFLSENAVELQDDGGVAVNDEMETSVPGVFAIGDIRNTPFKQVVVAAADGVSPR